MYIARPRLLRLAIVAVAVATVSSLATFFGSALTSNASANTDNQLRVQLKWFDQAQFAGYYVAIDQDFFAERGLSVQTIPGSATTDPFQRLRSGQADVAEASMAQAQNASVNGKRYVNIAQIFQQADSILICRSKEGFNSANKLHGARIAVSPDRQPIVRKTLGKLFDDGGSAQFVTPLDDNIRNLVDGVADCIWGSSFNEYWQAHDLGLNVFTVDPQDYGVVNIEDGLYVDESRLQDPAFRGQLVALLEGLKEGWAWAAKHPSSTVEIVVERNGELNRAAQLRQLESVLPLLGSEFGFFDVERYEVKDGLGFPSLPPELAAGLWTHEFYNAMLANSGRQMFLTPVTTHYVNGLRTSVPYVILLSFGIFAAAVSGALVALRLGYRLWGMVVLASLTALGGGVLRDVLLGGSRYPIYLSRNTTDIWIVLAAVAAVAIVNRVAKRNSSVLRAEWFATNADVIGFSIIALNGAAIAIIVGAPLIWVPISAAMSVAGGGILTDVVSGREHAQFRGELYEEVAVIGAFILLGLLWLTNGHEQSPWLISLMLGLVLVAFLMTRYFVLKYDIRYPTRRTVEDDGGSPISASSETTVAN